MATSRGALRLAVLDLVFSDEARWASDLSHQAARLMLLEAFFWGRSRHHGGDRGGDAQCIPGIDDPDDATPWAANLSSPDMMDLARAIKRDFNDAGHAVGPKPSPSLAQPVEGQDLTEEQE